MPGKNVRVLAGHPLLAYSVAAARQSGVFGAVVVSTESETVADVARRYGAEVPFYRPAAMAAADSPDIDWVRHALDALSAAGRRWDCFSILRPTSPFRSAQTIQRAWQAFLADGEADSLRAVEPCHEHPAKMWRIEGRRMTPVLARPDPGVPWHSMPYQQLPPIYVQNASLEIARWSVPATLGSIAGERVMPFITEGLEGLDINGPDDWILAEHHAREHPELLPRVEE